MAKPTSDLPKPKQKPNPEKERWLKNIRNYKPLKQTITLAEYKLLRRLAFKFQCPMGINPFQCDEFLCMSKPKPQCLYGKCEYNQKTCGGPSAGCYEMYFWDCREYKKYRIKLLKVQKGKIQVE